MTKIPLLRPLAALATVATLLLAACGGGGGGGSSVAAPGTIPSTSSLGPSAQYEASVAGCTVDVQKKFVRSYLDEVYLWYDEIPVVDASQFTGSTAIQDYFDALLVRTPDVNAMPKDRFSAVIPTTVAASVLGTSQQADLTGLLANHTSFVPVARTVTSPGGRLAGYIQFNAHEPGAQDDLITAFRQMLAAGVQDLVLDLRFNSGGFLYIAQTTASMVTGPASEGKVFEKLQYNAKRQAETDASALTFAGKVQVADDIPGVSQAQYPLGSALPQLNLPRLFVLTSGRTCSASESIINSLRGIDVQVIRIGEETCGKPYGFRERDNCGWALFPIELKGTNAKGYGDYTTGFTPNCRIRDVSTPGVGGTAGSATDPLLAGALTYMDTGACPAHTATTAQSAATPLLEAQQPTLPAWAGRRLR
jgi:hypothetical protein